MDLDVVFLGTAGSMPTARRGPSATLVRRGGERLLIDCGEGTQRQLLRSDLGLIDLQEIFLTHFHADHFLGLPGMLKTFALRGRELPLTLYGPRGLDELFQSLRRIFGRLTFEVAVVELAADAVLPRDGYSLRTFPARHGRDAIGYALVEEHATRGGKILNDQFSTYIIPTTLDTPEIRSILVEHEFPWGPYGAKGLGETPIIAVAPAVTNAIQHAVGVRLSEIPATPERVWAALRAKAAATRSAG